MSESTYETKTIRFHFEGRGQYLYVMITSLPDSNIMNQIGYGNSLHFQFNSMSAGEPMRVGSTDLFKFVRKHPWDDIRDSFAMDFLYALDTGEIPWDDISDGDGLTKQDVQAVV